MGSIKSIQPRVLSGVHTTLSPLSLPENPDYPTTISHACHATFDKQKIETTIYNDSKSSSSYAGPLASYISDFVTHPLETRPRCFSSRSPGKRSATSDDSDVQPEIYDVNRMSAVPTSPKHSSLSVYKSSTTVFAWPRLLPASQMGLGPVLYADFSCARFLPPCNEYQEPSPLSQVTIQQANCVHSLNIKRSKLIDIVASEHTLPPVVYRSPHPHLRPESKLDSHQNQRSSTRIASGSHDSFSVDESSSDSDDELGNDPVPTPSSRVRQWEAYAEEVQTANGRTAYLCLWTVKHGDRTVCCNYSSKKQLVKRHIETTHLKFKPFVCDICQKAFPQKTSLEIHMSGHTGDTPHECKYNCGEAFKDPARRHRHHVDVHGYVPRTSKKKHKIDMPEY